MPADVPHVPPRRPLMSLMSHLGHSTVPPSPRSTARWDMWDITRARFSPGRHPYRGQPPGGGGCLHPALAGRGSAGSGTPPGVGCGPRLVTGRHPPPPARPPRSPPCPLSATRPGSRSTWPRSAGTSCRCRPPANGPWATARPAAPSTAPRPTSPDACPCLAVGGWCHGVRAATTDPAPHHHLVAARTRRGARRGRRPLRPGPGRHRRPRRPAPAPPGHRPAARHRPGRRAHPGQLLERPSPVPRRPRHPHPPGPAPRRPPPLAPRPRAPARHRRHPVRRRAPVVPGTRRRAPPGPQRPPRPVRAGLASRPQSRLVLRHRPRRRHHRRRLPDTRRRPRPARPHARLARP